MAWLRFLTFVVSSYDLSSWTYVLNAARVNKIPSKEPEKPEETLSGWFLFSFVCWQRKEWPMSHKRKESMVKNYCYTMLQITVRPWLIVVFHLVSWSVKWSRRVSNTFRIEWYNYCKRKSTEKTLSFRGILLFFHPTQRIMFCSPQFTEEDVGLACKLDEQVIKIRSIPFNNSKFLLKQ